MALPKVLILNQPFNNRTGGGITLTNLFAGWDTGQLAVVCKGHLLRDEIDQSICQTYYQLGQKEHKWIFPFSIFKRKYPSGLISFKESEIQKLSAPVSKWRLKLILDYFYPLLNYSGMYHAASSISLSDQLCAWLDDWKPDVIYAQAVDRIDTGFCMEVQKYLDIPMIFHMMDDWPEIIGGKGPLNGFWKSKIDREFRAMLDQTEVLLGISDLMAEEYKRRYNKEFIPFHNPIDLNFWKQAQRTDYQLKGTATILYAGRTGLGIQSSLIAIARAVEHLNRELSTKLTFVLQTAEPPEWIADFNCVEHRSFVPYSELPKVFSAADFLILPYDFSPSAMKYIKYSMPTKVSEYMISGTPIIVFAPEDTAIVNYARQHKWGQVISENDVGMLIKGIQEMVLDKPKRERIAQNAKELAEARHASAKVTKAFKSIILQKAKKANVYSS
jgi:glycosyltransferase involved in cell wall biosynthesis